MKFVDGVFGRFNGFCGSFDWMKDKWIVRFERAMERKGPLQGVQRTLQLKFGLQKWKC